MVRSVGGVSGFGGLPDGEAPTLVRLLGVIADCVFEPILVRRFP